MIKPSDYFKKLDLAHLDANTAQFIREKILTLPNIDVLEGTKEFETIKAIVEENFPRAIGIEPVVIEPIVEVIPETVVEEVIEPIIDEKQVEIDSISGQVSELSSLVELLNEMITENPNDLESVEVLELYNETLQDLKEKLSKLNTVISDAIVETKENIEEVKEVIKTDVVDTKGILTAPKKYKTEDGEEVLGYESDWNFGTKKHLGETVVYYSNKEGISGKYSVLTGILHKGEVIYSEDKISNKEFENKFDSEKEALDFAYEISLDKEAVDKYENGGKLGSYLQEDKKFNDYKKSLEDKYGKGFSNKSLTEDEFEKLYELKERRSNSFEKKVPIENARKKDFYVAVHESKDGYWTIASKPTTKELAEEMLGGTPKNEVGKVVTLEEARAHKKTLGAEYLYEKGGSVKSFNPESLIGYSIFGKNESSTVIGVKEISKDNIKLERKSNVGELKYESSFTLKELKDLYSGKKVGQYEAFKQYENGGEVGDNKHTYMMLNRLQNDNDYYLGFGGRSERVLWAGNVDAQIEEMKKLWNSLPENEKPEWLTMEDILEYEKKMKAVPYIDPSIEQLKISTENPLSTQLRKLTGDTWNSIDFENVNEGEALSTSSPFRHIKSGRIFQVIN